MADQLPTGYVICATPGCASASTETHCRAHRYRDDGLSEGYAAIGRADGTVVSGPGTPAMLLDSWTGLPDVGHDTADDVQLGSFSMSYEAVPVPWQRTRGGYRSEQRYSERRYAEWKTAFAAVARAALIDAGPIDGPVSLEVEVRPSGVSVSVRPVSGGRPAGLRGDADNYLKAVADGLELAGVYANDAAVTVATVRLVEDE